MYVETEKVRGEGFSVTSVTSMKSYINLKLIEIHDTFLVTHRATLWVQSHFLPHIFGLLTMRGETDHFYPDECQLNLVYAM